MSQAKDELSKLPLPDGVIGYNPPTFISKATQDKDLDKLIQDYVDWREYGTDDPHVTANQKLKTAIQNLLLRARKNTRQEMAGQLLEVAEKIEYIDPRGFQSVLHAILRENNDLPELQSSMEGSE